MKISKISEIKLGGKRKEFIYLDKMDDGTWRLCYTSDTVLNYIDLKKLLEKINEEN